MVIITHTLGCARLEKQNPDDKETFNPEGEPPREPSHQRQGGRGEEAAGGYNAAHKRLESESARLSDLKGADEKVITSTRCCPTVSQPSHWFDTEILKS